MGYQEFMQTKIIKFTKTMSLHKLLNSAELFGSKRKFSKERIANTIQNYGIPKIIEVSGAEEMESFSSEAQHWAGETFERCEYQLIPNRAMVKNFMALKGLDRHHPS